MIKPNYILLFDKTMCYNFKIPVSNFLMSTGYNTEKAQVPNKMIFQKYFLSDFSLPVSSGL